MADRVRKRRRWPWLLAGIPVLVIVLLVAAWGLAARGRGDHVARNVQLAGHDVSGDAPADVTRLVDQLADDTRTTPIHIVTSGHHEYDTTASALGLTLDRTATTRAVLAVDRAGL